MLLSGGGSSGVTRAVDGRVVVHRDSICGGEHGTTCEHPESRSWLKNFTVTSPRHSSIIQKKSLTLTTAKSSRPTLKKRLRIPTHAGAEMPDETGSGVIRSLRENEKAPEFPGLSVPCRLEQGMPGGGGGNRTRL